MTDQQILLTDIRDGIATLTLNRPRQMNPLSAQMRRRFGEAAWPRSAPTTRWLP